MAEFERELISERTITGLASARARGGRPYKMTPSKLLLAMASMGKPETKVSELCTELGITRQAIYRPVSPTGELARTEPTCYRGSWQPTATTNERRLGLHQPLPRHTEAGRLIETQERIKVTAQTPVPKSVTVRWEWRLNHSLEWAVRRSFCGTLSGDRRWVLSFVVIGRRDSPAAPGGRRLLFPLVGGLSAEGLYGPGLSTGQV